MSFASALAPPTVSPPGRNALVVGSVVLLHGVALWALNQGLLRPPALDVTELAKVCRNALPDAKRAGTAPTRR